MKKLINDPFNVVIENIEGFAKSHLDFVKLVGPHVVARRDAPVKGKVGIVVGGGSGHEPLFLGWVGYGMADVAALGEVFAAPSPQFIFEATKAANGGKGVLYLYLNYAGDNMNFDMAAEMAKEEGIETQTCRIWDDIASAPRERVHERRGLIGGLFAMKVAGAKAEMGASLSEVKKVAERVRDSCRTYAVGLSPATIPASGLPTFTLGENEVYFGIGAHGEKGVKKTELLSADKTTEILVDGVIEDLPFQKGDEVNLIVNGYGSTTMMELCIISRKAHQVLRDLEISIHRTEIGNFLTTQEMAGCSISLMRLDEELKELYDAPAYTPIFKNCPTLLKKLNPWR